MAESWGTSRGSSAEFLALSLAVQRVSGLHLDVHYLHHNHDATRHIVIVKHAQ
jgi:hypothetical protein